MGHEACLIGKGGLFRCYGPVLGTKGYLGGLLYDLGGHFKGFGVNSGPKLRTKRGRGPLFEVKLQTKRVVGLFIHVLTFREVPRTFFIFKLSSFISLFTLF